MLDENAWPFSRAALDVHRTALIVVVFFHTFLTRANASW